jgi:hypothetical protein
MRRVLLLSCLVLGCVSVAKGAPMLVCDQAAYDFGKVDESVGIEHTFVLKNEGDAPLEIKQVQPSPGCAVTAVSSKIAPPGGDIRVTAKMSLRGRSGPQHKAISIASNDPEQSNFTLSLHGAVVAGLEINPGQLEFGNLNTASAVTGIVEVALYTTNVFTIGKVQTDNPCVAARSEVVRAGKAYRIVVTTQPPLQKGALRSSVRVITDEPAHPSLNIVVSGVVTGD